MMKATEVVLNKTGRYEVVRMAADEGGAKLVLTRGQSAGTYAACAVSSQGISSGEAFAAMGRRVSACAVQAGEACVDGPGAGKRLVPRVNTLVAFQIVLSHERGVAVEEGKSVTRDPPSHALPRGSVRRQLTSLREDR